MRALFGHRKKDAGISSHALFGTGAEVGQGGYTPWGTGHGYDRSEPDVQAVQEELPSRVMPSPRSPNSHLDQHHLRDRLHATSQRRATRVPPTPSAGLFLATPLPAHASPRSTISISPALRQTRGLSPHVPAAQTRALAGLSPPSVLHRHAAPFPSRTAAHRSPGRYQSGQASASASSRSPRHAYPPHHQQQLSSPFRDRASGGRDRLNNSGQVAARIKRYSVNLVDVPAPHHAVYTYERGQDGGESSRQSDTGWVCAGGSGGGGGRGAGKGGGGSRRGSGSGSGSASGSGGQSGRAGIILMVPKLLGPGAASPRGNATVLSPTYGSKVSGAWGPNGFDQQNREQRDGTTYPSLVSARAPLSAVAPHARNAWPPPDPHAPYAIDIPQAGTDTYRPRAPLRTDIHLDPAQMSRSDDQFRFLPSDLASTAAALTLSAPLSTFPQVTQHHHEQHAQLGQTAPNGAWATPQQYSYAEYANDLPGAGLAVLESAGRLDGRGGGARRPLPIPMPRPRPAPQWVAQTATQPADLLQALSYPVQSVQYAVGAAGGRVEGLMTDDYGDVSAVQERGGAGLDIPACTGKTNQSPPRPAMQRSDHYAPYTRSAYAAVARMADNIAPAGCTDPAGPAALPPPMALSTSRPGGPRPLGLSRNVTKLPVSTTYRGRPVGLAAAHGAAPDHVVARHQQGYTGTGVGGPCSHAMRLHSSDGTAQTRASTSSSTATLTRRAAISRASNQSYLSAASAYTARSYSSGNNAQHRRSLVSALRGSPEAGSSSGTLGKDTVLGSGSWEAQEEDHGSSREGAVLVYGGVLTDSPPQQSDNGRHSRAEDSMPEHHMHRISIAATDVTLEWQPELHDSSTQPPKEKDQEEDVVRAAWEEMDRKLGRRVNSALDAERGEWVARRVQRGMGQHGSDRCTGLVTGGVDLGEGLNRKEEQEWDELFQLHGAAVGGGMLDATVLPPATSSHYGALHGDRREMDIPYGHDDRQGRDQATGEQSPGQFSVSDYLAFGTYTPAVLGIDSTPRPMPANVVDASGAVQATSLMGRGDTILTPTPPAPHLQYQQQYRQQYQQQYHEYDQSLAAPTAAPTPRPFVQATNTARDMPTIAATRTPLSSVTSQGHQLEAVQTVRGLRPTLPPIQTIAARQPIPVVRHAEAVHMQIQAQAQAQVHTQTQTKTQTEIETVRGARQLQRTRTGRSRHLALGTSSIRVKHGHTEDPDPDTEIRAGHMQNGDSASAMIRASTVDCTAYTPSAASALPPRMRVGQAYDLSAYYNLDDSLFPVALSPVEHSPAPTTTVNSQEARNTESGSIKRRRTLNVTADSATASPVGEGEEDAAQTLRVPRDRAVKHKGPRWGTSKGISSADFVEQDQVQETLEDAGEQALSNPGTGHPKVHGKRNRDGLSRLDTQIVHAMRAFKSRASASPLLNSSIGLSATSPDACDVLGSALTSAGVEGAEEVERKSQRSDLRTKSVARRWGAQALSKVVSRSLSRRSKSRASRSVSGSSVQNAGEGGGAQESGRERVVLDTPSPVSTDRLPAPILSGDNATSLRPPLSPTSPVLITPPTAVRPLPISPPQQGLGLGVPIGLRSTYSLYNRPADLTLPISDAFHHPDFRGNAFVASPEHLAIPAGPVAARHLTPCTADRPLRAPLPHPPASTASAPITASACGSHTPVYSYSPYALPRSPIWPDAERDAAQMLRVKDLDTGHACEVAMSRVEQALASMTR